MNRIYPVIALLCVSMFFSSSIYAQSCSDGNINICMKEANQGNAASQYYLGFFYDTGEGVKQDKQKAVEWYRKAAEQGDARAQIDLGFAYSHGEGVKQDKQKAVEWYRKAAEQGNAIAQYNLGSVYDTGEGVRQNKQESVGWYRKAAEQGEVNAQYSLAYAYDTGEGVKQDHQKAAQWYEKAARQGDGEAQYTLGNIYKRGQGVSQNNIAAYMWLTLAAEGGVAQALKERASVEKTLTAAQLKKGQLLVRGWEERQTEIAEITKLAEPSWLRTHWHWCTFAIGILWIFLYWFLRGRDPSPTTVTARYQPPEGVEAAHAHLILEGNADESLDAIVLELVRDNYIALKKNKRGKPTLTRLHTDDTLPAYKQTLMDALFHSGDTLNVDEKKSERECKYIQSKLDQMKTILSAWSVEKGYMKSNPEDTTSRFSALGLLLTGLLFFIAVLDTGLRYSSSDNVVVGNFEFSGSLIVQSFVFLAVLATLVHLAKKFKRIFLISVAGLFLTLWSNEINVVDALTSPFMVQLWLNAPILSQGMLIWLVIIVAPYMPVKTALGTDIYAQLLGLKEYMSRVNKEELEEMLKKDAGYMHALIPYAQVFGLLEHWVHQVKGLEQLTQDRPNHTFEDSHLEELAGVSILTAGISDSLHNSGADSFSGGDVGDGGGSGGESW